MKKVLVLIAAISILAGFGLAQTMGNNKMVAKVTGGVRWSQCAFGPDGVLHICFEEDTDRGHPIWYFNYDGTKSSELFNVTDSMDRRGERPGITVSPRGYVVVTWGEDIGDMVFMRVYNPQTKAWQPIETVGAGYGWSEPNAAMDAAGNIYIFYSSESAGRVYVRAKLNGVWEEAKKLNSAYGKQGGVAVGPDGTAWALWREKQSNGNYKNWYSKRVKGGAWTSAAVVWTGGGSASHPYITVGPNNIAIAAWGDIDPVLESGAEIRTMRLETGETREIPIPMYMQHYPRPAVDANNKIHLAVQLGGGDTGDGCFYTNNVTGSWSSTQALLSSWPKVPGISADVFGNVAICQSNMLFSTAGSEIYVWSLQPIVPKRFFAPLNLSATVALKSLRKAPEITYNLAWSANPENTEAFIQGYDIYVKEGEGEYTLLTSVSKTTFATSLKFTDLTKKRRFALATVGPSGVESDLVEF